MNESDPVYLVLEVSRARGCTHAICDDVEKLLGAVHLVRQALALLPACNVQPLVLNLTLPQPLPLL